MGERLELLEVTRDRILSSAVALHATQGVVGTSWDDLARAASVNRATVYRHFPNLEALIPACARREFDAIDLPTKAEIEAQFADLAGVGERFERLVWQSCACFERGERWLRAAYREADLVPAMNRVRQQIDGDVATLVDVVLAGRRVPRSARATLRVLAGYPFWQQLIDSGVTRGQAPSVICGLIDDVVAAKETK